MSYPFYHDSLHFIDEMVVRWSKVIIPFFSVHPSQPDQYRTYGTGFLIFYQKRFYLVTAMHVVEAGLELPVRTIIVNGVAMSLENIVFHHDKANDVAIAQMNDFFIQHGLSENLAAIMIGDEKPEYIDTEDYLLMGYPGTQNMIKPRYDKRDRKLWSITAPRYSGNRPADHSIASPIIFDYCKRKLVNSELKTFGDGPHVHGMSGGPAFRLQYKELEDGGFKLNVKLQGVLAEWHKNGRQIIAASSDCIFPLIKKHERFLEDLHS